MLSNLDWGTTIHNQNGDDYTVLLSDKEYHLLRTQEGMFLVAWRIHNEGYWEQGHYFMDDLKAACDFYVNNIKEVK